MHWSPHILPSPCLTHASQLTIWQHMYCPLNDCLYSCRITGRPYMMCTSLPCISCMQCTIRCHIGSTNKPTDRPTFTKSFRPGPPASRSAQQSSRFLVETIQQSPTEEIVPWSPYTRFVLLPFHVQGTASAILQPLFLGVQPLRPGPPAPVKMFTMGSV